MPKIILIETSTSLCSVCLAEDGKITARRESNELHAHAAMTAPFVQQVLEERGLKVSDCDAVALSAGPGSYTGLRVGSSTAKGLCFAAGLPLISVSTLETLVWQAADSGLSEGCRYVVPMVDARRMEVYTAVYSPDGTRITEIAPVIVDGASFAKELSEGPVLFIGDGAEKCSPVLNSPNARFAQQSPRADSMIHAAMREFEAGHFEDTAYFEPFYLKQFVATVSKKNLF